MTLAIIGYVSKPTSSKLTCFITTLSPNLPANLTDNSSISSLKSVVGPQLLADGQPLQALVSCGVPWSISIKILVLLSAIIIPPFV
ncbi:MAG TPA: hypothetical protein VFC73_04055 [Syntrophomonadaceae bacterium]|nr:hypothetical protein [Syntrophomonadaceae bacterium]